MDQTKPPDPRDESFDRFRSTGYLVNLCARLITQRMAKGLRPLGVAPAQLPVLLILASVGESTQSELAERAAIEQPTMASTLGRMERDGLIVRTADLDDRRRAIIRLTPHARSILPEIEAIADAINAVVAAPEPSSEGGLLESLRSLAEALLDTDAIDAAVERARRSTR